METKRSFLRPLIGVSLVAAVAFLGYWVMQPFIHGPNAKQAQNYEFPWLVHLQALATCNGVVIENGWVLTAAHCIRYESDSVQTRQIRLYPGRRTMTEVSARPGEKPTGDPIFHPGYIPNSGTLPIENDLVLIPVDPSWPGMTAKIALASSADDASIDNKFVAGWACRSTASKNLDFVRSLMWEGCEDTLGYVDVIPMDRATCNQTYNDRFICTGGIRGTQLSGFDPTDSGGGLTTATIAGARLVGIANSIIAGKPDAYARIAKHRCWIESCLGWTPSQECQANPVACQTQE